MVVFMEHVAEHRMVQFVLQIIFTMHCSDTF